MNYKALKIIVTCDEPVIRQWADDLNRLHHQLQQSLQAEKVDYEAWYLGFEDDKPFLICIMDVEDLEQAGKVFMQSTLEVDKIHLQFAQHWDQAKSTDIAINPNQAPTIDELTKLSHAEQLELLIEVYPN